MKKLVFNSPQALEAREKIRQGIKVLAEAVKVTLGPSGRVVMYEREYGDPAITKDGVTVAKQVELQDPFENMAAAMVRQAASKTAVVAGDGTTTATIYVQAIYEAGLKSVNSGANPQEIKRGIDHAVTKIIEKLKENAKPAIDLDQIKQVAVCSSNQDQEIGEMIANAMGQVGADGVITIEEGQAINTTVALIDGLQFPRGYISPQLATEPDTLQCRYDDPYILITDQKITDLKLLLKILEMHVNKLKNSPLVIIADDFSDDCIGGIVLNRLKVQLNIVGVKAPGFGDRRRQTLEDIAIATGGTLISKDGIDFPAMTPQHLGRCKKIRIDRDTTTILDGCGDEKKINDRIELLRQQLANAAGEFDKERAQERLARLTGSVAQIFVGGATEVEVREKRDRIEDALHACKAAVEEGILPGGGIAALHAVKSITFDRPNADFGIGVDIVIKAVEAPLRQIAINNGIDDGVVVNEVQKATDPKYGYNAVSRKFGDMIEMGVIVPTKVERVALQNAASVSGLLLTTDCMISIVREPKLDQGKMFPGL